MSNENPEINQPFRIIIECKLNGIIANLSSGYSAYHIEYQSPSGAETKVVAAILNSPGTDGKIYCDIAKSIFDDPRTWEAKPWLTTTSGDELPGDPVDILVERKWNT